MAGHDNIIRPPNEKALSELDEAWELALAEAKRRAHAAGRADIAQYLALRAQNDLLRRTAIDWLVDTLTAFAADANRRGAAIQIELSDAHNFRVGPKRRWWEQSLLCATACARCRSKAAGRERRAMESCGEMDWPAPTSNILAGRAETRSCCWRAHPAARPQWLIIERTDTRTALSEDHLRDHISVLLAEN